jgi:hypothetical protein
MSDPLRQFDFWLGEWSCSWKGGRGRNRVEAICDGRVIRESFDGRPDDDLVGTSISLYDARTGRWVQTWMDSQGSWFHLQGEFRDGAMELFTVAADAHGETKRMRFDEILDDGFSWSWASSADGQTWSELWRIAYRRARSGGGMTGRAERH